MIAHGEMNKLIALFSGTSNTALANEVAACLKIKVSRSIASASDDEHFVIQNIIEGWYAYH